MEHMEIDDLQIETLEKCLRCLNTLTDSYKLIFDKSGKEMQLQTLLSKYLDLDIKESYDEFQAICNNCLNELIDIYDLKSRLIKENSPTLWVPAATIFVPTTTTTISTVITKPITNQLTNISNIGINQIQQQQQQNNSITVEEIEIKHEIDETNDIVDQLNEEIIKSMQEISGNESKKTTINESNNLIDSVISFDDITIKTEKDDYDDYNDNNTNTNSNTHNFDEDDETQSDDFFGFDDNVIYKLEDLDGDVIAERNEFVENENISSIFDLSNEKSDNSNNIISTPVRDSYLTALLNRLHLPNTTKITFVNGGYGIKNPQDGIDHEIDDLFEHVETDSDSFICKKCSKKFTLKRLLKRHLKCHSEVKRYLCIICGKGFNDTFDLKRHTRVHTGVRPYKCDIDNCGKSFTQRCSLESHCLKVHGVGFGYGYKERRVKTYVCEECGHTTGNAEEHCLHLIENHPHSDTLNKLHDKRHFHFKDSRIPFQMHASAFKDEQEKRKK